MLMTKPSRYALQIICLPISDMDDKQLPVLAMLVVLTYR